jgi:hypothetical protein
LKIHDALARPAEVVAAFVMAVVVEAAVVVDLVDGDGRGAEAPEGCHEGGGFGNDVKGFAADFGGGLYTPSPGKMNGKAVANRRHLTPTAPLPSSG